MNIRLLLMVAGALLGFERARAAGLEVAPVLVELGAKAPSSTVTVRNAGTTPMRYQVSAMSWAEPTGAPPRLEPSDELAVFPPVFSLGPGQERRVRVGAVVKPGDTERSWRLFIEELPAPVERSAGGPQIAFRMRFAIPVFLAPTHPRPAGAASLVLAGTSVKAAVTNGGNVHLRPTEITVAFLGAGGEKLTQVDVPPVNVLAGSERVNDVPVPPEICATVRSAALAVDLPSEKLRAAVALPDGACAR